MSLHYIPLVATTLALIYLSLLLLKHLATRSRRRTFAVSHHCALAPPWPSTDPTPIGVDILWGNLRAFRAHTLLARFQHGLSTYSPPGSRTVALRILGSTNIVTADPRNLQVMLATKSAEWSIGDDRTNEKKGMGRLLGRGVFTTEGEEWKDSRGMLRGAFERKWVEDVSLFERHVKELIEAIEVEENKEEEGLVEVDLQPLFGKLSLDISTEFLFGESTSTLAAGGSGEGEAFARAFDYCQNPFMADGMTVWNFLLEVIQELTPAYFTNFVDTLISRALTQPPNPTHPTFLSTLSTHDPAPSPLRLRSECLNILLAGRDTTAALLSNLVWSLSRSAPTLTRLRAEIATAFPPSAAVRPSYAALKALPYLRAVLNESLRLHPVVPHNVRTATTDTTLPFGGGAAGTAPVFVAAGSFVMWSTYELHRRADVWGADAGEWRPERWLDGEVGEGEEKLRPGWAYLPFGGGPRICVGQQFALAEAGYVVVRLLQEFGRLESRDGEPWREKLSITCTGLGGCRVALGR
ncbi:cytochrome P450 [Mytilinidion resinicola]|uniref:Cytochrome P450 n=1 Tax=Mytilinidion resinicola TaxID=574789 RepID=A0A6A6Y601_9PEZI|nr:cytochrome P450 [Mytilinidion resinicola]KAF2804100.1 cytochrome P450 [Mytilinidion resinicola]